MHEYSRKGFVDGIVCRLPTVAVRPGAPNAAASSFVSGIIREPLAGIDTVCPVPLDTRLWIASPAAGHRQSRACGARPTSDLEGSPDRELSRFVRHAGGDAGQPRAAGRRRGPGACSLSSSIDASCRSSAPGRARSMSAGRCAWASAPIATSMPSFASSWPSAFTNGDREQATRRDAWNRWNNAPSRK